MRTLSAIALFAAGFVAVPVIADEKDAKKELTGAFKRNAGDLTLKIVFKKDNVMEFHIQAGDTGAVMTSKYTKDKDGVVSCEVTEFEKKGDFPVTKEKGYKFSFKWEMKDKKGVMSDLKGDDIDDNAKQAIEGDYETASD